MTEPNRESEPDDQIEKIARDLEGYEEGYEGLDDEDEFESGEYENCCGEEDPDDPCYGC